MTALEHVVEAAKAVMVLRTRHPEEFGSFEDDAHVLDSLEVALDALESAAGGAAPPADVGEIVHYLERWRDVRRLVEGSDARNSHVEKLIRSLKQDS